MSEEKALDQLDGLDWLVAARNAVQSFLHRLHKRWSRLDGNNRQFAAGAALSLWRAAFLLSEKEIGKPVILQGKQIKTGRVDAVGRELISRLVRTNTLTFTDEMNHAHFMAGYYLNNAVYRVGEMHGVPRSHLGSNVKTMRTAWNRTFGTLERFVDGAK